jgi:predicted ATPase
MWKKYEVDCKKPVVQESGGGFFSGLFGKTPVEKEEVVPLGENEAPNNVYLHGTVGTGKSFLMDLFYEEITDPAKKRVHFHDFMIDVHQKIHRWRTEEKSETNNDPIPPVAEKLCKEAKLICFDEFQVTDVADAMILKRLFENLMRLNVRFVITGNREPEELYKNGLNRDHFMPFVHEILRKQFRVMDLSSEKDYRIIQKSEDQFSDVTYFTNDDKSEAIIDALFAKLSHNKPRKVDAEITAFGSRKIQIPISSHGVCLFDFSELIQRNFGAADYLSISKHFHTVFLKNVPKMEIKQNNLLR